MLRKRWMTTLLYNLEKSLDPESFDIAAYKHLVSKLYADKSNGFYVHAPGIEDWDAIGVKSIYTGGGETHESPITWYDLTTGINTITASDEQPTEYYDLMGRRVDASKLTRGIYITNTGRKVMVK